MRESVLQLAGKNVVVVDGLAHPIFPGIVEQVKPGYLFMPYSFADEFGRIANGSVFELEPRVATNTYFVTGTVVCQEVPVIGKGWFLGQDPSGEVVTNELGYGDASVMMEYGQGWLATWIAGQEGMRVLSLTRPPFTSIMETAVNIGETVIRGTPISPEYWQRYQDLVKS